MRLSVWTGANMTTWKRLKGSRRETKDHAFYQGSSACGMLTVKEDRLLPVENPNKCVMCSVKTGKVQMNDLRKTKTDVFGLLPCIWNPHDGSVVKEFPSIASRRHYINYIKSLPENEENFEIKEYVTCLGRCKPGARNAE